jgi:hypothetical protein
MIWFISKGLLGFGLEREPVMEKTIGVAMFVINGLIFAAQVQPLSRRNAF